MTSQELLVACLFGTLMTAVLFAQEINRPRPDDHLPPSKRSLTIFSRLHIWAIMLLLFCNELVSTFLDALHANL